MKPVLVFLILVSSVTVSAEIPRAYRIISSHYGIPEEVFFSIVLQESGLSAQGKFLPWPWTLNIDNRAHFFDDRESAELALIHAMQKAGEVGRVGRVAVGIGQIYMPSHVSQFSTPVEALDPTTNLHYAAKLLATEFVWTVRKGQPDWWIAAGRYHTPSNGELASEYRARVIARCRRISDRCGEYGRSAQLLLATMMESTP